MEAFFFQGHEDALAVYVCLREKLLARWPQTQIEVKKTQITFREKYSYAIVSLPRQKNERGLVVTFGLGMQLSHPRMIHSTEAYPGRWTHHVPVRAQREVDGELLAWVEASREFSAAKK